MENNYIINMVRYLITLLFFQLSLIYGQVKHYQITQSSNLGIIPYEVYNSNEGNILLSNGEANWDNGYSHILKTKPNGDTIFIKSTDDERLFVTSNGNILSNGSVFQIVIQNYTNSYITMRDKNLNVKWQIDLSSNFISNGFESMSPPLVGSFYEITPNRFICSVSTRSSVNVPSNSGLIIMEFDSIGTVNSIRSNWLAESCYFGGKCNNNWVGYDNTKMIIVNTTVLNNAQFLKFNNWMLGIRSVCCKNNKIYATLPGANGHKAILSCLDTNLTVLWSKIIEPTDSTKSNYLEDLVFYNNTLIGKYQDDTSSYVLNFDTLGTLMSSNKILLNANEHITNLVLVNDSVYTSKGNSYNGGVSLIRMNSQGVYPCSVPSNFLAHNNTITNYPVYTDSLRPTSFSYSLSTGGMNVSSYTVILADECIVTGIEEDFSKNEPITVYPNPNNGMLNVISASSVTAIIDEVKITNTLGELVYESVMQNKNSTFNIQHLSNGIYFLSLYKNNELIEINKIIKQ